MVDQKGDNMSEEQERIKEEGVSKEETLLLKNTSFDELKSTTINTFNDVEAALLTREANVDTLDKIIKNYLSNQLFHNYGIDKVIPAIKDQFKREALSGNTSTLIFVGGTDFLEPARQNPRRQSALFIHVKDGKIDKNAEPGSGGFFDTYVWGSSPRENVSDKFEAGSSYDLKISATQAQRQDGTPVTYYNIRDYRHVKDESENLIKILKTTPTLNELLKENLSDNGTFSQEYMEILKSSASYSFVALEMRIHTVYPHRKGERVMENGKWVNVFKDDSEYFSVIQKNDRLDKRYPAFSISGYSNIDQEKSIRISAGFYPQMLGQFFIRSDTIQALIDDPAFLKETPEHQAQFMSVTLSGKKFLVVGKVKGNLNASADEKTLNVSLASIALIEL